MSSEDEVRQASKKFYAALNQMAHGDARAIEDAWSHGADTSTMHPVGGRETGWEKVRDSFAQVAKVSSEGQVRLDDQVIVVAGDVAWELGTERGALALGGERAAFEIRVTNVYRREAGAWKMVHHHTDPAPEMLAALDRLRKK